MSNPNVSHMHLQLGATWTFVHSHGDRTEYVYDRQMVGKMSDPKNSHCGLDAMHALLNPLTGKFAMVSEKWLRDGALGSASSPTGVQSHWLPGEKASKDAFDLKDAA